ncbi:MAG: SDR family NAD(P)-dependent oxidoreductase [bacterium]
MNIKDKSILVTGANRGIGRALVEEALRRGARTVYAAVRVPMENEDSRVKCLDLDVTEPSKVIAAAASVECLDVLVNNAGVALYDDLSDPEVLVRHLAVNLFGPLRLAQAFLPQLKRSRGALVNHLSIVALDSLPIIPSYSASKAALANLTQSLRALLAGQGVTVHGVYLGPVDTDMNRDLDIPKAPTSEAARGILDGLQRGEEDIFPDPVSREIADAFRTGAFKGMERQFAGFVQAGRQQAL